MTDLMGIPLGFHKNVAAYIRVNYVEAKRGMWIKIFVQQQNRVKIRLRGRKPQQQCLRSVCQDPREILGNL